MQSPACLQCPWLVLLFLAALAAPRLVAQNSPPVIVTDPQSQTASAGQNVTLNVNAEGTAPLSYQWRFESLRIPGETNSTLVLNLVDALDSGSYSAVVTNAFGSVTSAPAVLTVLGPPIILENPTNVTVYTGQSATFGVVAFSRTTNTYQWLYQGNDLPDATNRTLTLGSATTNNAGFYSVRVGNNNGNTTSLAAELVVLPLPMPSMRLGVVTVLNRIRVPVLYTAYGIETNLSFSAAWNTNAYTNPGFELALDPASAIPASSVVVVDGSQANRGRLGIRISWDPGVFLPPGEGTLGQLVFDSVEGASSPYAGRLALDNDPVPSRVAPPVEGQTNIILNGINPQVISEGLAVLNLQTGFLEQPIEFVNPGRDFAANARLTVGGLQTDRNTNAIALANAQGYLLPDFLPYVDFGAIASSEIRSGILQYYVTDRISRPRPTFTMYATPTNNYQPPSGTLLTLSPRITNGMVLLEFPTIPLYRYYIQYADRLAELVSTNYETSLPHVVGTGSNLQWMDSGPPRTRPGDGRQRMYRVLEVR